MSSGLCLRDTNFSSFDELDLVDFGESAGVEYEGVFHCDDFAMVLQDKKCLRA